MRPENRFFFVALCIPLKFNNKKGHGNITERNVRNRTWLDRCEQQIKTAKKKICCEKWRAWEAITIIFSDYYIKWRPFPSQAMFTHTHKTCAPPSALAKRLLMIVIVAYTHTHTRKYKYKYILLYAKRMAELWSAHNVKSPDKALQKLNERKANQHQPQIQQKRHKKKK